MRTLREVIQDAHDRHAAVGHFNVSDSNQLKAVAAAARELEVPVMVGVSEGERKWFGVPQIAAMVWTLKDAGQEIYLNADHTKTLEGIAEAIEYGFDEVLFDGSSLSIEENIAEAKQAVRMAGESGRDVLVEGELGYIGSGSTLLDKIPEGAGLDKTTPEPSVFRGLPPYKQDPQEAHLGSPRTSTRRRRMYSDRLSSLRTPRGRQTHHSWRMRRSEALGRKPEKKSP
jgi:fructose-bisphosphate aldolase class II